MKHIHLVPQYNGLFYRDDINFPLLENNILNALGGQLFLEFGQ